MSTDFAGAFEFTVMGWEGGEAETMDPDDPGGHTKWGLSQRAHPKLDIGSVTREQAMEVYERDYWQATGCDALDEPLARVVFDYAVNSGVRRVLEILPADSTLRRAGQMVRSPREVALDLLEHRGCLFVKLACRRRNNEKYLRGWMNRLLANIEYVKSFRGGINGNTG